MSWVSIWIHLVFSTKNRRPFLDTIDLRRRVFQPIRENAKEKDIWLNCVNGQEEHHRTKSFSEEIDDITGAKAPVFGAPFIRWLKPTVILSRAKVLKKWLQLLSEQHLEAPVRGASRKYKLFSSRSLALKKEIPLSRQLSESVGFPKPVSVVLYQRCQVLRTLTG